MDPHLRCRRLTVKHPEEKVIDRKGCTDCLAAQKRPCAIQKSSSRGAGSVFAAGLETAAVGKCRTAGAGEKGNGGQSAGADSADWTG